jgi:hypothetical protein
MAANPSASRKVEFKRSLARGAMRGFVNEAEQQLRAGIASHGKPYGVR